MSPMVAGLQGALLLARGRREGLLAVPSDARGVRLSFLAAVLCLPPYLCLQLVDWALHGMPGHLAHAVALLLLGYVVNWCGFALLSRTVVTVLGRGERWPLYVAAWNWCNVAQYMLLVGATVPALLGLPGWIAQTAGLAAAGWAVWLEWYAARLSLGGAPGAALLLTVLDVAFGEALTARVSSLS
jgi:hypothetical protein